MGDLQSLELNLLGLCLTWNIFRDVNLSIWHFSCIFLNIFKSFLIDLRELGALFLEFEVEERMFFLEIERIIREIGGVAGSDGW